MLAGSILNTKLLLSKDFLPASVSSTVLHVFSLRLSLYIFFYYYHELSPVLHPLSLLEKISKFPKKLVTQVNFYSSAVLRECLYRSWHWAVLVDSIISTSIWKMQARVHFSHIKYNIYFFVFLCYLFIHFFPNFCKLSSLRAFYSTCCFLSRKSKNEQKNNLTIIIKSLPLCQP